MFYVIEKNKLINKFIISFLVICSFFLFYLSGLNSYCSVASADKLEDNSISILYSFNEAKNVSSITNVDGFLTPRTWYRPKKIINSDGTYRNSTKKDLRPLLSVWWPDKQTEVNYINYMNSVGLGNEYVNVNMDQTKINYLASNIHNKIENKIRHNNGKTKWLYIDLNNFISKQAQWNSTSEQPGDGLQNGYLKFNNNLLTPYANSKWRLFGRGFHDQNGNNPKNVDDEFLLANDIDNSNPIVQAENLNWMYYLNNIGNINKNKNGNFDEFRIDAGNDMDLDILSTMYHYLNYKYKLYKSESNAINHLSIIEHWGGRNDASYFKKHNYNYLAMDSEMMGSFQKSLGNEPNNRSSINDPHFSSLVDRTNDYTENEAIPNYSFVRSHDQPDDWQVNNVKNALVHGNKLSPWLQFRKALTYYKKDTEKTNKRYSQYNIPSSYAILLTNKDTVPRIFYGDLYFTGGQYMAEKTPYYSSIIGMLTNRIKYVSGGQQMNWQFINGSNNDQDFKNQILTSVRFGKGALKPTDKGNKLTRTSGIGLVESNNPDVTLRNDDKVILHMGSSHKNQYYRPLIQPNNKGLSIYNNDSDTSIRLKTDKNGNLALNGNQIKGYSNPQVSGYFALWVPTGAKINQDVRTTASNKPNDSGRILNSNAALDSHVLFEAFSNYMNKPKNNKSYANVVLQKKAKELKNWGITDVEMAPQYRSSTGNTFSDETLRNGYAFNDRYDLGYVKPTKYGTINDLMNSISKLHKEGLHVMCDYVANQIYSLPVKGNSNQEVINSTRSYSNGLTIPNKNITNKFYLANTMSSGKDYQSKFGGVFLNEIRRQYPKLFSQEQISTGVSIDPSVHIRRWSAKYLNGISLQGNGLNSVLVDENGKPYMVPNVNNSESFINLPKLLNDKNN